MRILAVAVVVALAALWLLGRTPETTPSSEQLRHEVADLFGDRCRSDISVREIKDLGGPGLPSEMRAAREIVCDADVADAQPEDETGHPRLAVAFLFESDAAAREWIDGDDLPGRRLVVG